MKPRVVILDNYDSFTYNLAQYAGELDAGVTVVRNDEVTVPELRRMNPTHLIVSPGPGRPEDAGVSCDAVVGLSGDIPILGVCLGHQVIGHVMGAAVRRHTPMHGKTSMIFHDSRTLYSGMPNPFEATRYHSLVVEREGLPPCLEISGHTGDGQVMGIRHTELPLEGVQFHPESILTDDGHRVIRNFLYGNGKGGLS